MFRYMDDMLLEELNDHDQRVLREMNAISYMCISFIMGMLIFYINLKTQLTLLNTVLIFSYSYLITNKWWFSMVITFAMMYLTCYIKCY